MSKDNISRRSFTAIKKSLEVGLLLQKELPEIANDFKKGLYASEILTKYQIVKKYVITRDIAINSIYYALRGNVGYLNVDSYEGLMEQSELERLSNEHRKRHSVEGGKLAAILGVGVHGFSQERRSEVGRKAGKISGKKHKELATGIFSLSHERMKQRSINGGISAGKKSYMLKTGVHARSKEQMSKDAKKSIISKGFIPFSTEEIECAYTFYKDSEFLIKNGPGKGKVNTSLIAERINQIYHRGKPIRDRNSVYMGLKHRKLTKGFEK